MEKTPKPANESLRELSTSGNCGELIISELERRKLFYEFMRRLSHTFHTVDDFKEFVNSETKIVLTYQF